VNREQFEFLDGARGPCARLAWNGHTVTLTEWPGSLLAMLRAGVLGPHAKAEAEFLAELEQAGGDPQEPPKDLPQAQARSRRRSRP
jgi:hypothetical protein